MSVQSHTPTRIRLLPSTKIAIGFVLLLVIGYFGLRSWSSMAIDDYVIKPIVPGRVNFVGVNVGAGYRIVVQNRIAVLELGESGEFKPGEIDERAEPGAEMTGKRRVPIKELLGSLQGDEKALSRFVMIMNELKESEFPPERVDWMAADIRKALDGDKELLAKLEADLGVDMEGRPLPRVRVNSLLSGIIIHNPVRVKVSIRGEEKILTATIMQHFQSSLGGAVEAELKEKMVQGDDRKVLQGIIVQQAKAMQADPKLLQDVAKSLRLAIDEKSMQEYAAPAERVLASAQVILNEEHLEDASYTSDVGQDGESYFQLRFELTDEGRKRLWKYSKGKEGHQLLVVKDGVAIAAPRIRHELSQGQVDVTQLREEGLVKQTVELVKQLQEGPKS